MAEHECEGWICDECGGKTCCKCGGVMGGEGDCYCAKCKIVVLKEAGEI